LWMTLAVLALVAVMVPLVISIGVVARGAPGRAAAIAGGIAGFFVVILAFAAFIAIYVRYALAIQAWAAENLGPRASLKRSVFLTKESRWRVVVIYLIFLLRTFLHNRIAAAVLVYLAGFIAGSITGPLATIGLSLLYYDERVRKEAFDLQWMLLSLDVPGAPSAAPAQTTPAQV
jgi:Na+/melibiose symporter-like transporter